MSDHDTIIIDEDQNQDFREVDLETVEEMIEAGADRIGASAGVQIMEEFKGRI